MEMVEIKAKDWASVQIKEITITQDVAGRIYNIKVRQFIPAPGDATSRKWVYGGEPRCFNCTPYAIANMKEAGTVLRGFVEDAMGDYISSHIDETDDLLRDTYAMVYRNSIFAEVC